jgi:hypothetical protein
MYCRTLVHDESSGFGGVGVPQVALRGVPTRKITGRTPAPPKPPGMEANSIIELGRSTERNTD